MICKNCGTETRDDYCPRCGVQMNMDAAPVVPSPPTEGKPRKKRNPPLRMKMVFWQAIALLLPLLYLFFDAYVVLSDQMSAAAESGGTYLSQLFDKLCDPLFANNTVEEISQVTLGHTESFWQPVSFFSLPGTLFSGRWDLAVFLLPMLITLVFVLASGVAAVFLLLTGGRILRLRIFCNFTFTAATGAVFSPLIGSFLLRLLYAMMGKEHVAMQQVLPSLESLCLMGILVCIALPALLSLRRIAAYAKREAVFIGFPFRGLTDAPHRAKLVTYLGLSGTVAVLAAFCLSPISTWGQTDFPGLMGRVTAHWQSMILQLTQILTGQSAAVDMSTFAEDIVFLSEPIWLVLLLISFLEVLFLFGRVRRAKPEKLNQKPGRKKRLLKLGEKARGGTITPFITMAILQSVAVCLVLVFSSIITHFDLARPDDTLSAVYLVMARVRSLGDTTTLCALLTAAGLLSSHVAGEGAKALVAHASKENQTPKGMP